MYFWSFLPHFTHLLVVLRQKEKVAHRATFSFCLRRWLAPLELRVIATSYARWGSEPSAACGGRSEVSEWQRSQRATERREGRPMRAPQQGKQTRSVCENNPEVVWWGSHPRNQQKRNFCLPKVLFCLSEDYALIYLQKCAIINSQINKNLQVKKEVK